MTKLKSTFEENVLNQGEMLESIQSKITAKSRKIKVRRFSTIAVSLLAVFALGITMMQMGAFTKESNIVSIVAVDINPSIELSVDANSVVVRVKPMNKDARSLDYKSLVGLSAEEATLKIIEMATEAGFIDPEDLEEDYVLVTTVNVDEEEEEETEELNERLKDIIENGGELPDVNVVVMKAEKIAWFEANDKKVPLGMYVINGMVQHDGVWYTAGEFFSNPENKKNYEKKNELLVRKADKTIGLLDRFLDRLEGDDIDVAALRTRLETEGEDLDALRLDIKALWEATYGDEEGIDGNGKPKGKPENPGNPND